MQRSLCSVVFAALITCTAQCPGTVARAQDSRFEDAIKAVRAWYQVIDDGSNQADMLQFGTVGSGPAPLQEAYQQLAPQLREQMSEAQFFAYFQGLANVKLLQAHASRDTATVDAVRVFVEEERVIVIQRIPAIAWYKGFIDVAHTSGGWKISNLKDVSPEDIITLPLGGHMPWKADPEEVARVSLDCSRLNCKISGNNASAPDQRDLGSEATRETVQTDRASYEIDLAKLHSGEWVVLDKLIVH
jgi:hypothetical protein